MVKRFLIWIKALFVKPVPWIPPPLPPPEVFTDEAGPIGPDITITNHRAHTVILEGTVIRSLILKPGETRTIKSPIMESYRSVDAKGNAVLRVRKWDVELIVHDMIENWIRGTLYGEAEAKRGFVELAEMKLNRRVNVCGLDITRQ